MLNFVCSHIYAVDEGMRVPCMDIRQNRRRGLIASIYDKRLENKYCNIQVIRSPDPWSVLANKTEYEILTSQIHRLLVKI